MNLLTNFYFFVLLMQVTFGHQWVSSNKTDIDGGFYWVWTRPNDITADT